MKRLMVPMLILGIAGKLDDPAREGELKDGIKKTVEDEIYAIKHMRGKDSTPPKVERNHGIRVPGGFRRRRLLSSTNPVGGLKGMSALRKRAMRLEIEDMLHNEGPQLALRA